ncbi:MAG: peptide chain release factor N(5)-glutamine methyltransferase [Actinomycetota bacterium]|jgi:release factor glutamine methyltransferase
MKLVEALAFAKEKLASSGVPSPDADAHWLLAHATDSTRAELLTNISFDLVLTQEQITEFNLSLEKRLRRIPLQHITGTAAFRSLELAVGPGVFIPRFETEQVTQIAIDFLNSLPARPKAIDVGTGSGAIAISLAKETNAEVYAIELSASAVDYARANIEGNEVEVKLFEGEFELLLPTLRDLDLIISNPPYIPISAVPQDPEVRDFDPELALYSGEDGLDAIRALIDLALLSLRPGGMLVLEHADGQSDLVRELLLEAGYGAVSVHPDPTGRLRAVSAIRRA